ncbi:hypothetical protein AVJ23_12805 [Pseudoponticoccus marisrubri]|uniref:Uncharacterized protein n=2 Tax=Pseudoponticoccus marisrubri TaxID=1685382 RepID=A0A0W7WIF9_9RHOB|nr:hypothetical protein AVJ23_12805 [Pseudoponticoccus marisrubri]
MAVPSLISAWADRRRPWTGVIVALMAAALIGWAVTRKPGGYTLAQVPEAIYTVIARLLN